MHLHSPVPLHFASLLFMSAITALPLPAQDALQPMFNGKDLTGWVLTNTPPDTWSFSDGLLVCTGKPIGEIRTEKMYQNFVMELEWRHMVPRGNAGVFVWADDITARGVPFHRGIEVQVLENAYGQSANHTTHGDIFPIHGAQMTPLNGRGGSRAFPTENLSLPSPQWNHYRIECRDGAISLAVNGRLVTQGRDCSPRKGYICLESEGGVVHYRNVRIEELPSSDLPADQIAIANRGYRSLYTGLNLDGWLPPAADSPWQSKDWVLAFDGGRDQSGNLTSAESLDAIGFCVDIRLKADTSSAMVTAGAGWHVDLGNPAVAKELQAMGSWNRIEATKIDGEFVLMVNGRRIELDNALTHPGKGPLTLQATGSVDFCNLYARSL